MWSPFSLSNPYPTREHEFPGIAQPVADAGFTGWGAFSESEGTIAYIPAQMREIALIDPKRKELQPISTPLMIRADNRLTLLADDDRQLSVAFAAGPDQASEIYKLDQGNTQPQRLTHNEKEGASWLVASAGGPIYYGFQPAGGTIGQLRVIGAAPRAFGGLAKDVSVNTGVWDVAPDGTSILIRKSDPMQEAWYLRLNSNPQSALTPFKRSDKGDFADAHFSPDMQWIAYASNIKTKPVFHIYVERAAGNHTEDDVPEPISKVEGGGVRPRWGKDGRLYFLSNSGAIIRVSIDDGKATGRQVMLDVKGWPDVAGISDYLPLADGRFVITRPANGWRPPSVSIVVNWQNRVRSPFDPFRGIFPGR
jgi:hypothetical protein